MKILLTSLFFICATVVQAQTKIGGCIENIPERKVYLTNRGFASGSSYVRIVFDSCLADSNGNFLFKIQNFRESLIYSIEFNSIQTGWIPLLPLENENIYIKGRIMDRRQIDSITGSKEYYIQTYLDQQIRPMINKMNAFSDSIGRHIATNIDSAKMYIALNKLYSDSIKDLELKHIQQYKNSIYSLYLLNDYKYRLKKDTLLNYLNQLGNGIKKYELFKNLLQFTSTKREVSLNDFPPPIHLVNKHGKKAVYDFGDRRGKITLIDFWASWCIPCRQNIPELKSLYDSINHNRFEFIGISIDTDKTRWKNALNYEQLSWPNFIIDEQKRFSIQAGYPIQSIPKYILINSEGKVIMISSNIKEISHRIREINERDF